MTMAYSNDFKLKLCKLVCDEGMPVTKVSEQNNIERRTLQEWLRKYRANPNSFHRDHIDREWLDSCPVADESQYKAMTVKELRHELMKKDIELARLKKGYAVKGVGAEKEYVSISKKNTK